MALFTILTAVSTPLIVMDAAGHYLSWSTAEKRGVLQNFEEVERISKVHRVWNAFFATGIFVTGALSAVIVGTILQTVTPLILAAVAFRVVVIGAIVAAFWTTGEAVNDLCVRWFSRAAIGRA